MDQATLLINPAGGSRRHNKKRRRNASPNPRRRNGVANPRRRRRRNPYIGTVEAPRRSNPRRRHHAKRHHHRRHHRRRNPGFSVKGVNVGGAFKDAAWTAAGIYGTRYVTRGVLGQNDAGVMGYGANIVTALLLAIAARMAGAHEGAQKIAAGGLVSVVARGATDLVAKASSPALKTRLGLQDYLVGGGGYPGPYVESGTGDDVDEIYGAQEYDLASLY